MSLTISTLKSPTRVLYRSLSSRASTILSSLDLPITGKEIPGVYDGAWKGTGDVFKSVCPSTMETIAHVRSVREITLDCNVNHFNLMKIKGTPEELQHALMKSREAYLQYRHVPAPRRGEIVRQIRQAIADKVTMSIRPFHTHISSCQCHSAMSLELWCLLKWERFELKEWEKFKNLWTL